MTNKQKTIGDLLSSLLELNICFADFMNRLKLQKDRMVPTARAEKPTYVQKELGKAFSKLQEYTNANGMDHTSLALCGWHLAVAYITIRQELLGENISEKMTEQLEETELLLKELHDDE